MFLKAFFQSLARALDLGGLMPFIDPFAELRAQREKKRRARREEHARFMREMAEIGLSIQEMESRIIHREVVLSRLQSQNKPSSSSRNLAQSKEEDSALESAYYDYLTRLAQARALRDDDWKLRLDLHPQEADREALAADWRVVGRDLQHATEQHESQYSTRSKTTPENHDSQSNHDSRLIHAN